MLEHAGGGGGASALSEGIFYPGGGTPVQQACGYEDTAQNLYDFQRASTSHPDDHVVRTFAEGAREHFDWLEQQGVPFTRTAYAGKAVSVRTADCLLTTGNEKVWPFKNAAQPVPRGHHARSDEVNGDLSAMRALLATCEAEGVETICNAAVTGLEIDETGRVVGVSATIDGTVQRIGARQGLVIATGSFTNNAGLVQKWLPQLSETSSPLGVPSNDGAGLGLAQQAGAALAAMDGVIATASIYPPENLIKGIVVNASGERFVAEDSYKGRLAGFIMEQPGQKAYLIVDSEIFAYPETEGARHVLIDGYETVAEMESGLGLPKGALERTLGEYNRDAAEGEDTRLHKQPPWLKPLDQAPFAAFDISFDRSIYFYITLGGIDDLIAGFGLADWTLVESGILHGPNWKLAFDAHLEFYHVPVLHRETFGPDRSNRAFYFAQGPHQRVIAPQGRPGAAVPDNLYALGRLPAPDELLDPLLMGEWILFPGTSINTFYVAGTRCVLLSIVAPGAEVGTSTTTQTFLAERAPDDAARTAMRELAAFLAHVVGDEDLPTSAFQQKVMGTGLLGEVRFGRNEHGLQHFHTWLDRVIAADDAALMELLCPP